MAKKRATARPAVSQGPDIDCTTCIHREGCERAAENTWCTSWKGREPADRGPDPNKKWYSGDDFPEADG